MNLSKERVEAILAGCEGVTPGPWEVYEGSSWRRIGTTGHHYDDCAVLAPCVASDGHPDLWSKGGDRDANLAHIANCDPQTIAALASEVLALREAGWQDISTAEQDHREPDILLYSHHYDQAGRLVEYHTVGRWAVGTGPNGLLDGWEGEEGVHMDGFFTHWKPLTSPDVPARALQPTPEQKL